MQLGRQACGSLLPWMLAVSACAADARPLDAPATETTADAQPPTSAETLPSRAPSASASPTSAPVTVTPAPAAVRGAIYAALFEENRTFSFHEVYESRRIDEDGKQQNTRASSDARCHVSDVVEQTWGVSSTVTCETAIDVEVPMPLGGLWVATPKGLYRFVDGAGPPVGQLDDEHAILPRTPARRCWKHESAGGDPGWQSLCFDAAGVESGTYGWTGGSTHEVTFSRAPVK